MKDPTVVPKKGRFTGNRLTNQLVRACDDQLIIDMIRNEKSSKNAPAIIELRNNL